MTVKSSKICIRRRLGEWLVGIVCLIACSHSIAQSTVIDTSPPVIEHEELVEGVADSSQVFTVQIAEETELQDAVLYYRRNGQQAYTAAMMRPLGESGFYTASIATDPTDLRPLEYYIQARDSSGNRTVSGFAFDPFSRRLTPATAKRVQPSVAEAPVPLEPRPTINTAEPFYKKRWFQVTMGVIAVGILANSIGGEEGEDIEIVPVTINLRPE